MASSENTVDTIFRLYAEKILNKYHARNGLLIPETFPHGVDALATDLAQHQPRVTRIAIVGAGVAGLSSAMFLKDVGAGVEIDILEANDRIGGRLYTHRFNNRSNIGTPAPAGTYDYFDVGAMRFPDIPAMKATFELFTQLNIPLIPYHRLCDENLLAFNNVRLRNDEVHTSGTDPFRVSTTNGGGVPDSYAQESAASWYHKAIGPFIQGLLADPSGELDRLIADYDHYSTRGYMAMVMKYPPVVINWIETFSSGTGWFDRGLIEAILEELAFDYDGTRSAVINWKCVDGGSEVIPKKMVSYLEEHCTKTSIKMQHRVTTVKFNGSDFTVSGICRPSVSGGSTSFETNYSHVILAIPPPCIRTIDISTCHLDYDQRNALRELQLAPSNKVGIKFKTAWWSKSPLSIIGGQSNTDRLVRAVVYPSQGGGVSTALIASYSWTQDSLVLGTLINDSSFADRLKHIMLVDLAYIHGVEISFLEEQFEFMYAFDWTTDPYAMGAFGLFGPNQFGRLYESVTRPAAKGRLHFAGETFSMTHGWVAGALESAQRAVYQLLKLYQNEFQDPSRDAPEDLIKKFKKDWNPDLVVKDAQLDVQLLASKKLQKEEYGDE